MNSYNLDLTRALSSPNTPFLKQKTHATKKKYFFLRRKKISTAHKKGEFYNEKKGGEIKHKTKIGTTRLK